MLIPKKALQGGLRFGDQLYLSPVAGSSRCLPLKRAAILIKSANDLMTTWTYDSLSLQSLDNSKGRWHLKLIGDEKGRYYLESIGEIPFLINGTPCLKAWPLRGDQVLLGHNLLESKFCQSKDLVSDTIPLRIIKSNLSILIEGETGTGKSFLAKKIHQKSDRPGRFMPLNLKTFNPHLLESELFGHIKGAFTGAIKNKTGALAEASGGTLFLDEIDSLPEDIQIKLLLFLDNFKYRPVGGSAYKKIDVRMIFASGKPVKTLVKQGLCRSDFYYRISQGATAKLPSLRENPNLLKAALKNICLEEEILLNDDLFDFYLKCPWPGNYRQLRSHLNRKKILSKGRFLELCNADLELLEEEFESPLPGTKSLEEIKNNYIWLNYISLGKNVRLTAKKLKISVSTVRRTTSKKPRSPF